MLLVLLFLVEARVVQIDAARIAPVPVHAHSFRTVATGLLPQAARAARAVLQARNELPFDTALRGILAEAERSSLDTAVDAWLDRVDETFIPELASRIASADPAGSSLLPLEVGKDAVPANEWAAQLRGVMDVITARSKERYAQSRDQLQELLGAGEINKMDQRLSQMVRDNEIDAGFFYVLYRNAEDAKRNEDESGERLLWHIHTRLQEELEKKAEPGLALLTKLMRLDSSAIRQNVLRDALEPKTSIALPDGRELKLDEPSPANIEPMALATAILSALEKVSALGDAGLDAAAVQDTAEGIRQVAKEAREVIVAAYDEATVEAFTDALTPAFRRALSSTTKSEGSN
jgi:hypothetical protein